MKKLLILISISFIFTLSFADEKSSNSLTVPKKANMQNLLLESKKFIKSKNQSANVYTASTAVDVSPDDLQYFDFLTSAYNQAILQLKASIVLRKSGTIAIEEAYKFFHKTVPDDMLKDKLKKDVDAKILQIESLQAEPDTLFGSVGDIVHKAVNYMEDEDPKSKPKRDKIEAEVIDNLFTKAYSEGFVKEGFDEISGLIPSDTFIITNENGEVEIGVVGYTTPKSMQLARDLRQGHQSKTTSNQANCKNPSQIATSLSDDELLEHFGLKYFYNQNCHPSLLAYGMDSFIKEDGMNSDYRNESIQRARAMADKFISNFLSSNVSVYKKDTKLAKKTKDAFLKAMRENSNTSYNSKKIKRVSLVKEFSQEFSSSSTMGLQGLEDVRIWNIQNENSEVVGVIRYYSYDSKKVAQKEFNPSVEEKKAKSYKQKVQHSSNIDVDDF